MTLDVLGVCILGEDNKFLKGENEGPLHWYKNIISIALGHPVKTLLSFLPFTENRDLKYNIEKFNGYILGLLEKHQSKPEEQKKNSLLSLLVGAINDKSLTVEVVKNNLTLFFLAGHETTSTSLQFCLYNLSQNPEYQSRLRNEILTQFPTDELDYEKVKEFNIIQNLVNETLRMYPPVTYLPPRECLEDTEISGWLIPKGHLIQLNVWKILHDKETWGEDAFEFNPDRFDNLTPNQRKAFLPFGGGARICLGMTFSLLEQKLFFIKLLKKYEVKWAPDSKLQITVALFSPKHETLKFVFSPIETK